MPKVITKAEAAATNGPAASEPAVDASFRDLATAAANIDAGRKPDDSASPVQLDTGPPIDPAVQALSAELYAMLQIPRDLIAPEFAWWPEFGKVWSDRQLQAIAGSFAALAAAQGWDAAELLGRYGPWLALAASAGLPAFTTWKVTQLRKAQIAEARKRATQAPPPAPTPAAPSGSAQ